MIVVIGLLAQIAAVVAAAGVATNSGSTQPLSGSFVIFGLRRGTTARRVPPRPARLPDNAPDARELTPPAAWTAQAPVDGTGQRTQHDRAGDRIEPGVDTRSLHLFDPGSGLAIGGEQAAHQDERS